MSVIIIPPLDDPSNFSASLTLDGSLEIGRTYFFKMTARQVNSYAVNSSDCIVSPPSVEISATTDVSNRSINLSWDPVANASMYVVYARWESENWGKIATSGTGLTTANTTYNFYNESQSSSLYSTDLFTYSYDLPLDISKNTGVGAVCISGTTTLTDIYTTIKNSDYPEYVEYTPGLFVSRMHIYSIGTGSLTIPTGTTIAPIQCTVSNFSSEFTWSWGKQSKLLINAWSWRALKDNYHTFDSKTLLIGTSATGLTSNTYILGGDNYIGINVNRIIASSTENVIVQGVTTRILGAGSIIGLSTDGGLHFESNQVYAENVTASYIGLWHNDELGSNYYRNCTTIYSGYSVHCYYGNNLGADFPFYDCTFSAVSDSDPNKPIIYLYNTGYAHDFHAGIYRSLIIDILDEQGNPIADANILITDSSGNIVINENFTGEGQEHFDIKVSRSSWKEGYTISTWEDYNPFTLTISKYGYETYVSTFFHYSSLNTKIALMRKINRTPLVLIRH